MIFHFYILACGVIAFVYAELLTEAEMFLNPIHRLAVRKLPQYLHKPLISCPRCVSGQIALWTYLWYYRQCDSLFNHVYFVCSSILITWILSSLKRKIEN